MIALAIKLDDGGPVLYSQYRVGKGLRKFRLLKFRSMFIRLRGRQFSDGAPGRAGHAQWAVFCGNINWMSCRSS